MFDFYMFLIPLLPSFGDSVYESSLRYSGVEADSDFLFHPHDKGRWGFDNMPTMECERGIY